MEVWEAEAEIESAQRFLNRRPHELGIWFAVIASIRRHLDDEDPNAP